jgi:hypothetical protein
MCACKADDQVLTPDGDDGGRGTSVTTDASLSPVITVDAGGTPPAQGEASTPAPANDAAISNDAATPFANDDAAAPAQDAGGGGVGGGGDGGGGPVTHTAKDPDCDLNGVWIGRQITVSEALFVSQFANNWYYLELTQDGENVVVSKHMDCGIFVRSFVAQVELSPATTKSLIPHNKQVGRKGSFRKQSDGTCAFEMEKFWSVRGVSEATYAPNPRSRDVTVEQMQMEKPLPTKAMASAAEDWDGDGKPGIAWQVSVLAVGTRNSGQRDWTRWFSGPGHQVTAAANFTSDLLVRAEFANEEVVYDATDPTLETLSVPDGTAQHNLALRFLGRTPDDPRAKALIKADDFATCMAIQAALPPLDRLR